MKQTGSRLLWMSKYSNNQIRNHLLPFHKSVNLMVILSQILGLLLELLVTTRNYCLFIFIMPRKMESVTNFVEAKIQGKLILRY